MAVIWPTNPVYHFLKSVEKQRMEIKYAQIEKKKTSKQTQHKVK